jgi:hypothetical protein
MSPSSKPQVKSSPAHACASLASTMAATAAMPRDGWCLGHITDSANLSDDTTGTTG